MFMNQREMNDPTQMDEAAKATKQDCFLRVLIHTAAAASAAKSRQSCLTLCDPIDGSPPGPSIPGIFQARVLEWVAIAFSVLFIQCHH